MASWPHQVLLLPLWQQAEGHLYTDSVIVFPNLHSRYKWHYVVRWYNASVGLHAGSTIISVYMTAQDKTATTTIVLCPPSWLRVHATARIVAQADMNVNYCAVHVTSVMCENHAGLARPISCFANQRLTRRARLEATAADYRWHYELLSTPTALENNNMTRKDQLNLQCSELGSSPIPAPSLCWMSFCSLHSPFSQFVVTAPVHAWFYTVARTAASHWTPGLGAKQTRLVVPIDSFSCAPRKCQTHKFNLQWSLVRSPAPRCCSLTTSAWLHAHNDMSCTMQDVTVDNTTSQGQCKHWAILAWVYINTFISGSGCRTRHTPDLLQDNALISSPALWLCLCTCALYFNLK